MPKKIRIDIFKPSSLKNLRSFKSYLDKIKKAQVSKKEHLIILDSQSTPLRLKPVFVNAKKILRKAKVCEDWELRQIVILNELTKWMKIKKIRFISMRGNDADLVTCSTLKKFKKEKEAIVDTISTLFLNSILKKYVVIIVPQININKKSYPIQVESLYKKLFLGLELKN